MRRRNTQFLASTLSVSALLLAGALTFSCVEASAQGDVTVKKNPDGSIETYDTVDSYSGSSGTSYSGGGVHGAGKPYTRKTGGNVTVRRNADGSIETWDTVPSVGTWTPPARKASPKKKRRRVSKRRRKPVARKATAKKGVKRAVKKAPAKPKPKSKSK